MESNSDAPSLADVVKRGKANGTYYTPWNDDSTAKNCEGTFSIEGTKLMMMMEDQGFVTINQGTIDPVTKKVVTLEKIFKMPWSDNDYNGAINDDYTVISGEYTVIGKNGPFTWVFTEADETLKAKYTKNGFFEGKYGDKGDSQTFFGSYAMNQGNITLTVADSSEIWQGTINMFNRRVLIVKKENKDHYDPFFTGFINEELTEITGDNIQISVQQED